MDSGTRELRSLKDEGDQLKRELLRKEKALAEAAALLFLQKLSQILGGRGQMTVLLERHQMIELVGQAITAGARRQDRACDAISSNERTSNRN